MKSTINNPKAKKQTVTFGDMELHKLYIGVRGAIDKGVFFRDDGEILICVASPSDGNRSIGEWADSIQYHFEEFNGTVTLSN